MAKKPPRSRKRATIYDVGKHAGVSHITVSRVVNSSPDVSEKTRARVLASVKTLGYTPNLDARGLRDRPIQVGFLFAEPTHVYIDQLLWGALQCARSEGCHILAHNCTRRGEAIKTIKLLLESNVDGIILPAPLCDYGPALKMIGEAGVPTVLIDRSRPPAGFSAVSINHYEASAEATEHLLAAGHRRIGFIKGHPARTSAGETYRGFADCMARAGLAIDPAQVAQGYDTYRSGLDAADYLLNNGFNPTAIFASTDDMAAATLSTAQRYQVRVPEDLSLVGFDDIAIASMLRPQLTTVRRFLPDLAAEATKLVLEEIRSRRAGVRAPVSHKLLKHSLMLRESSAPRQARRPKAPSRVKRSGESK